MYSDIELEFANALNRFQGNLDRYKTKITNKNQNEDQLCDNGIEILNKVNKIKNNSGDLGDENIRYLIKVLNEANATWVERYSVEKSKAHAQSLAHLSQHAPGKSSSGWKALGIALLTFACSTLVAVGILAAIPSGGSSLLLTAIGAAGLAASAGVGAGVVAAGGLGVGALILGKEKELAKSVNFFKESLAALKTKASSSEWVLKENVKPRYQLQALLSSSSKEKLMETIEKNKMGESIEFLNEYYKFQSGDMSKEEYKTIYKIFVQPEEINEHTGMPFDTGKKTINIPDEMSERVASLLNENSYDEDEARNILDDVADYVSHMIIRNIQPSSLRKENSNENNLSIKFS